MDTIAILTPAMPGIQGGNQVTAERWKRLIEELGYSVVLVPAGTEISRLPQVRTLVALHARRSAEAVKVLEEVQPRARIVVVVTGTDLYSDYLQGTPQSIAEVKESLHAADAIVLLEPSCARHLPDEFRKKTHVVLQSAEAVNPPPRKPLDCFRIVVCGHLRDVKDPFRTEQASRLLPDSSRIAVVQIGSDQLQPELGTEAGRRQQNNPRYEWKGNLAHDQAVREIASSHLLVLSSRVEGAANVLSEAIVNGVPVLATRIDASTGALGEDYPGLFDVGDTKGLARLMEAAESDPAFLASLARSVAGQKHRFSREAELQSIRSLLDFLFAET